MIRSKFAGPIAVVLLSVPGLILWHIRNHGYPSWDGAGYLWVALSIYRRFILDGLWAGIEALYSLRGWKMTFHPVLAVPAFFLTSGRVLQAQALTTVTLYASLAVTLYSLSRFYLSRLPSILAVTFLLNIPWMNQNGYNLNSELPFALFYFGTWAALFRSECFTKKWPSRIGAVCMGIAFCVRPAEAAILFSVTVAAFVVHSARSGKLSPIELRGAALAILLHLPGLIWVLKMFRSSPSPESNSLLLLAILGSGNLSAWLLYFFRFKKAARTHFLAFLLVSTSVVTFWFAPYFSSLLYWMLSSSYQVGPATENHRMGLVGLGEVLRVGYFGVGEILLLILAMTLGRRSWPRLKAMWQVTFLTLFIHFGLGALSYNRDSRYYLCEFASICLLATIVILRSRIPTALKYGAVAVLLADAVFRPGDFGRMSNPWTADESAAPVFEKISSQLRSGVSSRILLYTLTDPVRYMFTPNTLELIALSRGFDIQVSSPDDPLSDWKTWHDHRKRDFDYYLIGPLGTDHRALEQELRHEGYTDVQPVSVTYGDAAARMELFWVREPVRSTR